MALLNFTADVTESVIGNTGKKTGLSVWVTPGSTLGGGTINVLARPSGHPDAAWYVLTTAAAVDSRTLYTMGSDIDFAITIAGSTTPNINIMTGRV